MLRCSIRHCVIPTIRFVIYIALRPSYMSQHTPPPHHFIVPCSCTLSLSDTCSCLCYGSSIHIRQHNMSSQSRLSTILQPLRLVWPSIKCTFGYPSHVTRPYLQAVHYRALKEAIRKDGLVSLLHPRRIGDAATAKMLTLFCNSVLPAKHAKD